MIYFKNEHGDVFAYETQADRDQYGASDLVKMTPAEVEAHLSPVAAIPSVAIASRRYEAETSGTIVDGMPVNTERDSQALLTGAALQAMLDPNYNVRWKTAGGFVELDAQQIIGLASAVRAHVQACFDREAELLEAIDAGTYSAEMIDEGWP